MKNALPWMKKHWIITLCSLIALVSVPVLIFVASGMLSTTLENHKQEVNNDYRVFQRKSVTYAVPSIEKPGTNALEESGTVNPTMIEHFQQLRDNAARYATSVSEQAVAFNKASHEVLVEGLFPEPSTTDAQYLPGLFAKRYVGPAHRSVLEIAGAGTPPDHRQLLLQLREYQQSEQQRLLTETGQAELTEEQQTQIRDQLLAQRLASYRQHAREIDVYAGPGVFIDVPAGPPNSPPTLGQCWDWQVKLWAHQDIFSAIANVNAQASNGVIDAVIKRVVAIDAGDVEYTQQSQPDNPFGGGGRGADPATPAAAPTDLAAIDYATSITGRAGGVDAPNNFYDVRTVKLRVIASGEQLPRFFDALAHTNFMTVLDIDVWDHDPQPDLAKGYYYGPDPVVLVDLTIETIWLREWTKPLMPPVVRTSLGIPDDPEPAEAQPEPQP